MFYATLEQHLSCKDHRPQWLRIFYKYTGVYILFINTNSTIYIAYTAIPLYLFWTCSKGERIHLSRSTRDGLPFLTVSRSLCSPLSFPQLCLDGKLALSSRGTSVLIQRKEWQGFIWLTTKGFSAKKMTNKKASSCLTLRLVLLKSICRSRILLKSLSCEVSNNSHLLTCKWKGHFSVSY